MRISFQIAFVVLIGFGAIYAGVNSLYSPANVFSMFYNVDISLLSDQARLAIETQTRFLAGMWISAGIFTLIVVRNFEANTNAMRIVLLGLGLGSIGELVSVITLNGELQPAIIKTSLQVGIYLVMELWRAYMCKKVSPAN